MNRWLGVLILVCLALALALACSSGDDDDATAADDDTGQAADDDAATDDDAGPSGEATWMWIPIEGFTCRDGSKSGIAIRMNPQSDKLMVYLQGGGACYDPDSCADNPSHFGETDLAAILHTDLVSGIFNTKDSRNPVRDWNMVFVPYCTGDIFAGNQPDGAAPGVPGKQQFVGFQNVQKIMMYIERHFSGASQVLLSGTSAGGFGTLVAYAPLADNFRDTPVILLDDSGPFVDSNAALPPCYQFLLRLLWNVTDSIPSGCRDCSQLNGDGISNLLPYLAHHYPLGRFGLFSSLADATIRDYWGMGQNHCTGTGKVPADVYRAALLDERKNFLEPTGKWWTFYINGETHGILTYEDTTADWVSFYSTAVGDMTFTGWLNDLITDVGPLNVGP